MLKTLKILRNNWKKSLFAGAVISYGAMYVKNYIHTQNLMHAYCAKAAIYGKEPLSPFSRARHVKVILNPNANKRKATADFEKYCAPLLHLAGIFVEIVKTESEGHAKTLADSFGGTDAIVVAGGDGTVSEVVTGLLRITHENTNNMIPIGILPLGKKNLTAKSMFPNMSNGEKVKALADATLAVIEQAVKPVDIMKIEILEDPTKPVYALNSLKWGAYRDADVRKDKYWYFGPFRSYATYIFSGLKSNLSWRCDATLNYNMPCEGCSNCYRQNLNVQPTTWFHKFIKNDSQQMKFASIINPNCLNTLEKEVSTVDLSISVNNVDKSTPKVVVEIGPKSVTYLDFIRNGIKIEKGKKDVEEIVEARAIKLNPQKLKDDNCFSIDNEEYEVKPIKITLLPKMLNMFFTAPTL